MIVPSCSRAERLRTCGVGASSPASRVRRSTRLRLVRMPRWRRSRAQTLRWPSPTNGEASRSRRISANSSASGSAPSGRGGDEQAPPQPRRAGGAAAPALPTGTRPSPGRPFSTVPAAPRSPRAPRRRRAASLLLQKRPQDVDLELQLADLAPAQRRGAGRLPAPAATSAPHGPPPGTPPASRRSGRPAAPSLVPTDPATPRATGAAPPAPCGARSSAPPGSLRVAARARTRLLHYLHPSLPNSRHHDLLGLIECPDRTGGAGTPLFSDVPVGELKQGRDRAIGRWPGRE